jgi:hypothetical protein
MLMQNGKKYIEKVVDIRQKKERENALNPIVKS